MGVIKFTFDEENMSFEGENFCVWEMLKAMSILAHEAKGHGASKAHILSAVVLGVDDEAFNRATAEPIGGGVSISNDLAEQLRKLGDK